MKPHRILLINNRWQESLSSYYSSRWIETSQLVICKVQFGIDTGIYWRCDGRYRKMLGVWGFTEFSFWSIIGVLEKHQIFVDSLISSASFPLTWIKNWVRLIAWTISQTFHLSLLEIWLFIYVIYIYIYLHRYTWHKTILYMYLYDRSWIRDVPNWLLLSPDMELIL